MPETTAADVSRRGFLSTSAAAVAASTLAAPAVHAAGAGALKVALIGCGGRGTGAAANCLRADPSVRLWAACDVFEDRVGPSLEALRNQDKGAFKDRIEVTPDRIFSGFDGYKQAVDSGADLVILATSPGFRPQHFAYAVEKGKHVFMEKPHAVDATGARAVIETAKLAEQKNLGVCGGFTYRFDTFKRDMMDRLRGGAIGDILAVHTTFLTGELWSRATKTNDPGQMEYQMRMWYYFNWLSGDFLVEQAIHNVDKARWLMGDQVPVAATGMGGRQVRTDPKWGNIWDHFTVVYEFEGDRKVFLQCRQNSGCQSLVTDHLLGTKGQANFSKHTIKGEGGTWEHPGEHALGKAYDLEHFELIQSIRAGKPMNDGVRSATSTLMGIMGREAAYTGQRISWKQISESKQDLVPKEFAWAGNAVAPVAMPGKTKFV